MDIYNIFPTPVHVFKSEFDFKKISIRKDDVGRRGTFTLEEYDNLIRFMRSYVADKNNTDESEQLERMIIRDYVLISSNSCMRVGELRQLKWKDVQKIERVFDENEKVKKRYKY